MQCLKCGAKWIKGNRDKALSLCPVCECDYDINPDLKKYDKIQEVLLELIQLNGLEICKNPRILNAYLNDYFPEKEALRASIKNILEQNAGQFVFEYKSGNSTVSIESFCGSLITDLNISDIINCIRYLCVSEIFEGSDFDSEEYYLKQIDLVKENIYKEICLQKILKINDNEENSFKLAEFKFIVGKSVEGIKILADLAEKNNVKAMLRLADVYGSGKYCKVDRKKERKLLEDASLYGEYLADFRLGYIEMFEQEGNVDIDFAKKYFERAAKEQHPESNYYLYKIFYSDSQTKQLALEYLKQAVDLKDLSAKYEYAIHLLYGDDVQKNVGLAIRLLEECADENMKDAIQKLNYMYSTGFEVSKDKDKAKIYKEKLEDN